MTPPKNDEPAPDKSGAEEFHAELARRLQALRDVGSKDTDQNERLLQAARVLRDHVAELEANLEASEWLREKQSAEMQELQQRAEELEGLFEALALLLVKPGEERQRQPAVILRQVATRLAAWEKEKAENQGLITRLSHSLAIQQVDDDLDDAASRRNALRRLDEAIALAGKAKLPLFCLFLELDENELRQKAGSLAADYLLVQIAHRLKLSLRHRDVLLRYDASAFVLLTDADSVEHAFQHAQRLHHALSHEPVDLGARKLEAPIRIAVVGAQNRKSADEILRLARELLKKAKKLTEPIVVDPALVKEKK